MFISLPSLAVATDKDRVHSAVFSLPRSFLHASVAKYRRRMALSLSLFLSLSSLSFFCFHPGLSKTLHATKLALYFFYFVFPRFVFFRFPFQLCPTAALQSSSLSSSSSSSLSCRDSESKPTKISSQQQVNLHYFVLNFLHWPHCHSFPAGSRPKIDKSPSVSLLSPLFLFPLRFLFRHCALIRVCALCCRYCHCFPSLRCRPWLVSLCNGNSRIYSGTSRKSYVHSKRPGFFPFDSSSFASFLFFFFSSLQEGETARLFTLWVGEHPHRSPFTHGSSLFPFSICPPGPKAPREMRPRILSLSAPLPLLMPGESTTNPEYSTLFILPRN